MNSGDRVQFLSHVDAIDDLPRKMAESTGRFPPTPTDQTAASEVRAI